ncbi:MAG: hypothetical protein HY722_08040, partial [Planctomycetes bacterium]|nr:hypothetical protein [Planctomycetota bacterium]
MRQPLIDRTSAVLASAGLHAAILIVAAFLVMTTMQEEQRAILLTRHERMKRTFDRTASRAMQERPEVPAVEEVAEPVLDLEREAVIPREVPKGSDMSNQSNKDLESTSLVDAYGVGGGGAGPYGSRREGHRPSGVGGGPRTEPAVDAALLWLERHQDADGRWDVDGFERNCGREEMFPGRCAGPGG